MARLSATQIAGYARSAGITSPEALATAVAIAGFAGSPSPGESGGNPNAHNATGRDNSYGLWQINMYGNLGPARRRRYGISSNSALFNPRLNAKAMALESGNGQNFRPWSVYTSGAYRANLPAARAAVAATGSPTRPPATARAYEPAGSRCSGGPQPGARALMAAILDAYGKHGARSAGIYNCRKVAGTNTLSLHAEGRALDVAFPGSGNAYGSQLATVLTNNANALGIQQIIWDRKAWRPSTGWKPYRGASPHTDHLHIEMYKAEAGALTKPAAAAGLAGKGIAMTVSTIDEMLAEGVSQNIIDDFRADGMTDTEIVSLYNQAQAAGATTDDPWWSFIPGAGIVGDSVNALGDIAGSVAGFVSFITSGETWIRLLQVILGSAIMLTGTIIVAKDLGLTPPIPPLGIA